MSSDLQTRVITAFFFVAVMLLGMYFSVYSLWLLFGLINVFCLVEYQGIVPKLPSNKPTQKGAAAVVNLILGVMVYLLITAIALDWLPDAYFILFFPLMSLFFLKALFSRSISPLTRLGSNVAGILWITVPCALFVPLALVNGSFQPLYVMGCVALVWGSDTFAYFSGRALGRNALFKRVSPKKTWEGSIGGLVGCLICAFALSKLLPGWTWFQWSVVAVLAVVFGTLGDLVESLLKRSVKIKDSGTILPGHGGFLDRFDALLFAIPFIYAFVHLMR